MSFSPRVLIVSALLLVVAADPFVKQIHELQTASGGFHDIGSEVPSVAATSNAAFVANLYGVKSQINVDDASAFVYQQANSDSGYGVASGSPSDIVSTRQAILAYQHLNKDVPNAASVGDFIRSLGDETTGLFGGDLTSTALAAESLDLLGELQKGNAQAIFKKTNSVLAERVTSSEDGSVSRFTFADSTSPIADQYHGVLLASKTGFSYDDKTKFAAYVAKMQNLDSSSPTFGGFYANAEKTVVTPEATAQAVGALRLLGSRANEEALKRYVGVRKSSLEETANSHLAFAQTSIFVDSMKPIIAYDGHVSNDASVMEGTVLSPRVIVTALEGKVAHGGFSVSVSEKSGFKSNLHYNHESYSYVGGDDFDTTDKLGNLEFVYSLRANVYPIGEVALDHTDARTVGFTVNIDDSVSFSGRDIEAGESVVPGTDFSFDITLSTASRQSFTSGDFELEFSVVDASGVVHHSESIDGKTNAKSITFDYVLTGVDFPAGPVNFVFAASNEAGTHTTATQSYNLDQQMVASNIAFDGDSTSFKIGDKVKISMVPGTLKDLHNVAPFTKANGASRLFILDLISAKGTKFLSIEGQFAKSGDNAKYDFIFDIPATLDFIGTTTIGFRFASAEKSTVKVQPFDSEAAELFEDAITFSVDAKLELVGATAPATEVTFGTTVPLTFTISDSVSGKDLTSSDRGLVSVVVRSGSGEDTFESSRVAVAPVDTQFDVTVAIDANAIAGAGQVAVVGQGVDGDEVPISGAAWPVNVGGEIKAVAVETYTTTSSDATKTAFIASFGLECNGQALTGANLVGRVLGDSGAVVNRYEQTLDSVPVTVSQDGVISMSVTFPHSEAATGAYKFEFVRAVDIARAAAQGNAASPLVEVSMSHKKVETVAVWMQMELYALMVLTALFMGVSTHWKTFNKKKSA